jgi:hypothetical protein
MEVRYAKDQIGQELGSHVLMNELGLLEWTRAICCREVLAQPTIIPIRVTLKSRVPSFRRHIKKGVT